MRSPFSGAWIGIILLLISSCSTNPENRQGMGERLPRGGQSRTMQGPNQNGKGVGGIVESIEGMTILINNPEGKNIIVTTETTKFTKDGKAASLTEVTKNVFIAVTGTKQSNGSWLATEIAISDKPPKAERKPGTPPPENR